MSEGAVQVTRDQDVDVLGMSHAGHPNIPGTVEIEPVLRACRGGMNCATAASRESEVEPCREIRDELAFRLGKRDFERCHFLFFTKVLLVGRLPPFEMAVHEELLGVAADDPEHWSLQQELEHLARFAFGDARPEQVPQE